MQRNKPLPRIAPEDLAMLDGAVHCCFALPGLGPPGDKDWEALVLAGNRMFGNGQVAADPKPEIPVKQKTGEPTLTIVAVVDAEKDPVYTDWFFTALRQWNRAGLDDTQVLVLCQKPLDPATLLTIAKQPFPVDVAFARHPTVAGYPVWDVCQAMRDCWPMVRGEYVTFAHTEFLWCPRRLRKTVAYLEKHRPIFALGNLRRLGRPDPSRGGRKFGEKEYGKLKELLQAKDYYLAACLLDAAPTAAWVHWLGENRPGPQDWREDVFFVRRDWLDAMEFWQHGDRQAFQDVYDLVAMAILKLGNYGVAPPIVRMPMSVNRILHMWHERHWKSWTPAMRAWFLDSEERWEGTSFTRSYLWDKLLLAPQNGDVDGTAINILRWGHGGTVTRFINRLDDWLLAGGLDKMKTYREEAVSP